MEARPICTHGALHEKILVDAENGWWRDTRYEESEAGTWDLHYYMRRWNGREWTLYEPKAPREAEGFAAIHANDVWAISGDQLWRWNGSYWQTYKAPLSRSTNAFAFSSDNDVWTVGEEGQIGRWDGNGWKDVYSPFAYRLSDVVFVTPTDGWGGGGRARRSCIGMAAAGSFAQPFQPQDPGPSGFHVRLYALSFSTSDDGWVMGDWDTEGGSGSLIMHWNGSNWETVSGDFVQCWVQPLNTGAVSAEAGEGWAMGGYYAMRWDGIQWGQVDVPGGWWLSAVSILAKNNSWAAGAKGDQPFYGLAIHWDGQEWKETSMHPTRPGLHV